jgi:GNAT superfamily N-acetyltransferase
MSNAPRRPSRNCAVRDHRATAADMDSINANDQEWAAYEHGGYDKPYSLDGSWAVLIAQAHTGRAWGWMNVVNAGDHLTLQLLYVDPHQRRRGAARALVEQPVSNYREKILLAGWDRHRVRWIKLRFVFKPAAGDPRAATWSARRSGDPAPHHHSKERSSRPPGRVVRGRSRAWSRVGAAPAVN